MPGKKLKTFQFVSAATFSKETVRVKLEQQRNAEMKDSLAADGGYHDGRKYYKKKTKGNWFELGSPNWNISYRL